MSETLEAYYSKCAQLTCAFSSSVCMLPSGFSSFIISSDYGRETAREVFAAANPYQDSLKEHYHDKIYYRCSTAIRAVLASNNLGWPLVHIMASVIFKNTMRPSDNICV